MYKKGKDFNHKIIE